MYTQFCCYISHKLNTPKSAPLARELPVDSSEISTAFEARLPNIFHFSHPASEQKTVQRHPLGLIRYQVNIQGTRTPPKLLYHPHNFPDT